jgi:hypothetical protein
MDIRPSGPLLGSIVTLHNVYYGGTGVMGSAIGQGPPGDLRRRDQRPRLQIDRLKVRRRGPDPSKGDVRFLGAPGTFQIRHGCPESPQLPPHGGQALRGNDGLARVEPQS